MLFGIVNGWISFHGGLVKLSVSGFPMLYIPRRASGLDTLNAFSENFTRRQQYVRVKILRRIRSSIDTSVQKKKGGGRSQKKFFSALRASLWSKNKGREARAPPGPSPGYAKCPTNLPIDGNANIYVLRLSNSLGWSESSKHMISFIEKRSLGKHFPRNAVHITVIIDF